MWSFLRNERGRFFFFESWRLWVDSGSCGSDRKLELVDRHRYGVTWWTWRKSMVDVLNTYQGNHISTLFRGTLLPVVVFSQRLSMPVRLVIYFIYYSVQVHVVSVKKKVFFTKSEENVWKKIIIKYVRLGFRSLWIVTKGYIDR